MPRSLSVIALALAVPLWAHAAQPESTIDPSQAHRANATQAARIAAIPDHPMTVREAILSGALTDAELKELADERTALKARHDALRKNGKLDEAAQRQLQAERQAYADKVRTLIENGVKGPPRKTLPEGWRQHGTIEAGDSAAARP